ncbi:MAG: hypothetical protein IT374_17275 [Polyangiaceae bacterium]|nr:hypothetical protein [Polyangiaceae bacterium]
MTEPSAPPRTQVPERVVLHGAPVDFRTLAERAIPRDTEHVVFDLDRTIHLGRNMGELLGWELAAEQAYGVDGCAALEEGRPRGRLLLAVRRPLGLLRYIAIGLRDWGVPGLTYFFWGKLAARREALRRRSFLRFGPEPVREVQRIPQTTLLSLLCGADEPRLRRLARAVWRRHAPEQVITREDVAWLRGWCPGVRVILSSASPEATVAVAAEELGVDDFAASTSGRAPGEVDAPVERLRGAPRAVAGPGHVVINAGDAKIAHLARRHPRALARGARTVGVTDTGYGEDHAWADHFARVIDVNSDSPFVPIVRAGSPLVEIHSAAVLTREERATGALDPRRGAVATGGPRELAGAELDALVSGFRARAEQLAREYERTASALGPELDEVRAATAEVRRELDRAALAYNEAPPDARGPFLTTLEALRQAERALVAELHALERPLSEIAFALCRTREGSRAALAG